MSRLFVCFSFGNNFLLILSAGVQQQQQQQQHFGTQRQFGSNGAVMCEIKDLYLMMGREFETLEEVPAGNMIGKIL